MTWLTLFTSVSYFYTPWNLWFPDVFRGYRNRTLAWKGLMQFWWQWDSSHQWLLLCCCSGVFTLNFEEVADLCQVVNVRLLNHNEIICFTWPYISTTFNIFSSKNIPLTCWSNFSICHTVTITFCNI